MSFECRPPPPKKKHCLIYFFVLSMPFLTPHQSCHKPAPRRPSDLAPLNVYPLKLARGDVVQSHQVPFLKKCHLNLGYFCTLFMERKWFYM